MTLGLSLIALLVFPGLLYALPMNWLMVWIERSFNAKAQGRIGPPFYQPFYDFVKLMAKRPVPRSRLEGVSMTGLPLLAAASAAGGLALLPVFSGTRGFVGDLVLLAALLELPPICLVLAGFASRSLYGEVGAIREAVLAVAYSLPFLGALIALAASAGSLSLGAVASAPSAFVRIPALLALLLCLPIKLRLNPFSLSNAEQEIYAGPTTEYDGPRLALWELAHGLEWVLLTGLAATLLLPVRTGFWLADGVVFVALSLIVCLVLSLVASATARLKTAQAARVYWSWGLGFAVVALVLAMLPVGKG